MLKLLLLLCRTLDLEGQSLPLHLRLKLEERKSVFRVCMNVVQKCLPSPCWGHCIVNYVLNLHPRISEGHELNTYLCELRQELSLCYRD